MAVPMSAVTTIQSVDVSSLRKQAMYVTRQDLIDALQVMIMAWEAQTTIDGLHEIGLTSDITFPLMPRAIKSYADAKAVLEKAK